jgi:polyhydroxybutyrate depolymerase
VLHGYGVNGFTQYAFFGMQSVVNAGDALVIAPDGTTDSSGMQFWNADPACCDFDHANPDDVGYIGGLIEEVSAAWPIDPQRVYVAGHSNGGYMAYRMACERADAIAAIGVLAGEAASVPSACQPSQPVSVLHLHGTADEVVPYDGGLGGLGAEGSVAQWASHDGCGTTRTPTTTYDLDTTVVGAETHATATDGCPAGIGVELWTMEGSSHIPLLDASFAPTLMAWFTDHE